MLILIPAKAASTRLKNKNMRLLGGKPLIRWAIDAAQASELPAEIIVSTEDDQISEYVNSCGVEVLIRPVKLAVDPAGVVDVALHALDVLKQQGRIFNTLVILLPTCPFRTAEHIQSAIKLFNEKNGCFLMSVSEYMHTPFAAMGINQDGLLNPYFSEYIGKKSQQMPVAYRANGAIHVLDVAAFEIAKSYYAQPLIGYVMPQARSIDIDNEEDLKYAEFLLQKGIE